MSKTYLGLDIGRSAIKLAVVSNGRVEKISSSILHGILGSNDDIPFSVLKEELRRVLQREQIKTKKCALVLPPESAIVRRITVPWMTAKQLEVNLPFEFHDYIQNDTDLYFYDYIVVGNNRDESGEPKSLDLVATTVLKKTIEDYRAMLRQAGLSLAVAVPQYLTYCNLISAYETAHPHNHPKEYCVADIGSNAIRVHMFRGSIYETSRIIEFGGAPDDSPPVDHIPLAGDEVMSFDDSDPVHEPEDVFSIAAVEIMRAVSFYGFNTPDSNLQDIYFSGEPIKANALMNAVHNSMKMKIHSIRELMPPTDGSDLAVLCSAAIAVAMGAEGR